MPRSRVQLFALAVGLLGFGVAGGMWFQRNVDALRAATGTTREYRDTASVLMAVRQLARLESVSFHIEKLIDLKERQAHLFGLIQADDAILLAAAGDVVAGVDLAKLRDGDIEIDPVARRARLRLPQPELLSVRLDNQRTYVHSRRTDLLAKRVVELESVARRHAEDEIRDAALEAGVLLRARESAVQTLTVLVRSLGYDHIDVAWQGE
jgi:Protein of unknown function (DUF4230)